MNQPVTWGPPPAERADAVRNRRLLLATAREIVAAEGADKLTMDGLAERAGLGKGTVFRRFGTRAGIFQALLDDDERDFQEQVLSGPPPPWTDRCCSTCRPQPLARLPGGSPSASAGAGPTWSGAYAARDPRGSGPASASRCRRLPIRSRYCRLPHPLAMAPAPPFGSWPVGWDDQSATAGRAAAVTSARSTSGVVR